MKRIVVFTFPIVNFPFLSGNIPAAPSYGAYISQLVWYSRACGVYRDFLDRAWLLTDKAMLLKGWSHRSWSSTDAITTWWTVMRQLFHRCKQMCFLDQLRSSSAPDLPLAITAGVVPWTSVPKGESKVVSSRESAKLSSEQRQRQKDNTKTKNIHKRWLSQTHKN
jgi:hypothetical protein